MDKEDDKEKLDIRTIAIANKLKDLRKGLGYTSAEIFAYENGLNRVSYWRVENGFNITIKTLLKILDIHGISLRDFFSSL